MQLCPCPLHLLSTSPRFALANLYFSRVYTFHTSNLSSGRQSRANAALGSFHALMISYPVDLLVRCLPSSLMTLRALIGSSISMHSTAAALKNGEEHGTWMDPRGLPVDSMATAGSTPSSDRPQQRDDGAGRRQTTSPSGRQQQDDGTSRDGRRQNKGFFDDFSPPGSDGRTHPASTSHPRGGTESPDSQPGGRNPSGRPLPGQRAWVPGKGADLPSWLHILIRKRE